MKRLPLKTSVLIGVNLILMGALAWRLIAGDGAEAILQRAVEPLPLPSTIAPNLAVTNFDLIRTQPIFHASRHFIAPPDPNAAPMRPPTPSYVFAGALALPGRPRIAYLRQSQSGAVTKVAAGDTLDGWSVLEVGAKGVTLGFGQERIDIGASVGAPGLQRVSAGSSASPNRANGGGGVRLLGAPAGARPSPDATLSAAQVPTSPPRTYRPPPGQ